MSLDPRNPVGTLYFSNTTNTIITKPAPKIESNRRHPPITKPTDHHLIFKFFHALTTPLNNKNNHHTFSINGKRNNYTKPRFIGDNGSMPAEIGAYIYSFLNLFELANLTLASNSIRLFILKLNVMSSKKTQYLENIEAILSERLHFYQKTKSSFFSHMDDEKLKTRLYGFIKSSETYPLSVYLSKYIKLNYSGHVPDTTYLNFFKNVIYPSLLFSITSENVECFTEIVSVIRKAGLSNYFFNAHFHKSQFMIRDKETNSCIEPLIYIFKENLPKFIRPLLELPNNHMLQRALLCALEKNDLALVEMIANCYKTNHQEPTLLAATRAACKLDNSAIVSYLISKGHDINVANKDGTTALHIAIGCKNSNVIRTLLEGGARCNVNSTAFGTIKRCAKKTGQQEIIILVKNKLKEQKEDPQYNELEQAENSLSSQMLVKSLSPIFNQNLNEHASENSNINENTELSSSSYNSTID